MLKGDHAIFRSMNQTPVYFWLSMNNGRPTHLTLTEETQLIVGIESMHKLPHKVVSTRKENTIRRCLLGRLGIKVFTHF